MKQLKKWIIAITILIIVIIVILVIFYIRNQFIGTDHQPDTTFENDPSKMQLQKEITKVENRNNFYAIKKIIGNYVSNIVDGGKESSYDILHPNYISEEQITRENVLQKIDKISTEELTEDQKNNLNVTTIIDELYYQDFNSNITTYFAYGEFKYNVNTARVPFSLIIEIDTANSTFYLYPTSYVEKKYPNQEDLKNYTTNLEQIPKQTYNEFSFVNVEDSTVINDYLIYYKDQLMYDLDHAYEMLEPTYRDRKFGNKENYELYVKENMKQLLSISIQKYKINQKEDYKEYILIDRNENYYILQETAIMDYKILLDNYTIDTQDFIKKYQAAKEETKVGMNIERIVQALNQKDYAYIYQKLDEQFKANNFDTLEKFKQYMNEKFPEKYDIQYGAFETENEDVYIQEIELIPKLGDNATTIKNNIIMQLKENTDFVMSFKVEI